MNAQRSDESTRGAATTRSTPKPIIVLVAQGTRGRWLHEAIQRIDPLLHPISAATAHDAVEWLTRIRPDILVLDLALCGDDSGSRALAMRLARLSPSTALLSFSDAPTRRPNPARDGWSWRDAELVLKSSIAALCMASPASAQTAYGE